MKACFCFFCQAFLVFLLSHDTVAQAVERSLFQLCVAASKQSILDIVMIIDFSG